MRVLVVDDQPVFRMLLSAVLGDTCEVVGEAKNGADALVKVATLRPDVVVMDLEMPTMDGIEGTRAIKRLFPEVRVICFTCLEDPVRLDAMIEAGASAHYDKSQLSDLLAAVAS